MLHQLCIPRDIYKAELRFRAKDIIYLDDVFSIMAVSLLRGCYGAWFHSICSWSEWKMCFIFILFSTTHCSLLRLLVRSGLDVPTFATRRLHACHHARASNGGRWNCGREMSGKFCLNADLHVTFRDLLCAVKLRHRTNGFTSPPKEGVLRIFFSP